MHFSRFGPEAAQAWVAEAMPRRQRWFLLGVGMVGFVTSGVGVPDQPCSPISPCTDVDIDSFGVFLGLVALSLLGLWLYPAAGTVVGLAASVVDVIYDPSLAARGIFLVYAIGCLVIFERLRGARRRQLDVLADIVREPSPTSHETVIACGRVLWSPTMWLGAGAAVLLALVSVGLFWSAKESDRDHRERAVEVTGTVLSAWNDQGKQRVSVDQAGLPPDLWIVGSGEYEPDTEIRLRVDPTDPTWTELSFDPPDHSLWLALAIFAGGVTLGLGGLGLRRRGAEAIRGTDGVGVEAAYLRGGQVLLRPAGGTEPVASFLSGPLLAGATEGPRSRRLDWTPGIVLGDFREWGWVVVRTAKGQLSAGTPLRVVSGSEWSEGDTAPRRFRSRKRSRAVDEGRPRRWVNVFYGLLGLGLAGAFAVSLPDVWVVAQGGGVSGTVVITSEDCGKTCFYTGDYRSDDGRYVFRDVSFTGSGDVGSTQGAVYVGAGDAPDEVYEPGSGDLIQSGFFILVGLGIAAAHLLPGARRSRPG